MYQRQLFFEHIQLMRIPQMNIYLPQAFNTKSSHGRITIYTFMPQALC